MSTPTTAPGGKRPTSGSTDTPPRDKRLKTIACDRCRRRKVKCDGDGYNHTPCKYCVSVNLDCTYGQKTGRTSGINNQSSSKANSTSRQTSRNPTRSKSAATNNTDNVAITSSTSTASTSRQRRASTHSIHYQNTKQTTKKSSQSISTSTNVNRPPRIIPQALPTFDSRKHDFEYTLKLFTSMTLQDENQVRQQIKHYVQSPQVEESSSRPQLNNTLLENTQLTGHLVDLYFKNFHPLLPVLHKAYFMERFYDKSKSMSPLLLCAVCAIGSSYSDNPAARKDSNDPNTVGLDYYECAQEMVNQYFDLPRLSTATALFLLGIFDALRSLKSRIYVGMATTLAITMRFHDKNAFPETLSVNEREARKRLWWGIAIANQLQCITLNRTLALQDNHCTIGYPDETEIDDTECKILEYFKHYIKITKIMYDILEFTLSESCGSDVMLVTLVDKLNSWKNKLPPFLSFEGAKELHTTYNETTIEHLRIYLCILYNYAMIRIHHPNISSSQLSLAACTRAANSITSYVNDHFVNMINSKQFIIHCALYAGFIHILNLKNSQESKESKRNIATTIKFFQSVLNVPSLHYIHYGIKNLIAIFATQLEVTPDVEDHIMDIVKAALTLVSGNVGSNLSSNGSPGSPATQLSIEESRNNNNNSNNSSNNNSNNNVSNIVQDMSLKLSPIQQSAQNSPPGINLLAHTAAARSSHYPLTPINHGPLQTQQISQSPQSIYTTSPAPLETQYIHNQTRHDNTTSTWGSNYNYQWPSNHLQPIQTQQHPNVQQQTTMSPTGNETTSMTSSSLPPLLIATTNTTPAFTSSQMQFPYQTSALPSMSFPQYSASQQQHSQHSSQSRQFPSTIGIGNFVTGNDMSTGLAPMTGMMGNNGGVTNGMMSTSENSVSMLIDSQGSGESSISQSGEMDAQQQHHHQHRRSSQQAQWWDN